MAPPRKREDNWIDGLRGLASFIVVTGNLCTAFLPDLHSPASHANESPSFFQLPLLRLCAGTRAALAIFFIITGFVNSLTLLKNARGDNTLGALKSLAKSAFARPGRLIIPTNIAICIAWSVCQIGGFRMAARADSQFIRSGAHEPDGSLGVALRKLFRELTLFWHKGSSEYDAALWTMAYFLQGSFRVYLALLAMMVVTTRSRHAITAFLYIYSWCTGDYIVGINIFAGLMLAQLQAEFGSRATSALPVSVSTLLITAGLFMCSYPQQNPEWASWSRTMKGMAVNVIPAYTDVNRYWMSVGATSLMLGLFFSPHARRVLSSPILNFLGRLSFPVYLLHSTLIRSLLTWLAYGRAAKMRPPVDDQNNPVILDRTSPQAFVFAMPIFYTMLYFSAYLWTLYIDPICARAVEWLKDMTLKEDERISEKQLPSVNGILAR